ncbi:MAG TPA: hypothetical protein GXX33_05605 [Firmicutes bacterium]|uniref:Uncharacterized protein n=1 Tax=Capillibacterium thermochitinicola TaxID=2699427 RepID=A0A8J6I117_9FIRM|nr:hypothetical protein [Capillibacterium thermochitinicola]MBA2133303.1 hypothetical protein [Capillibacterium thermochitinicola]HHW12459.1 hypothetical protein [Bacillota bacterium]
MVKRWLGTGKVIVKIPWPFGTKVHRIDLSITDLAVRWERCTVHITVEIGRTIRYVTPAGTVMVWTDKVVYQKDHPRPPALIRGQPLQATATTLYCLVQDQKGTAALEHGIGLRFSGWELEPSAVVWPPPENSLMVRGQQLMAAESYLHTETVLWPALTPGDEPTEAVLTGESFLLTPEGIHFRGELQLASGKGVRKKEPLSVLLPRKVPANSILTGTAKVQALKVVEPGKVLLAVKLDWRLFQEKTLPILLAPEGQGEDFLLWRLLDQEARLWSGQTSVKLPEKAKIIGEMTVSAVQSRVVKVRNGLLCLGRIILDLYYVNSTGHEKCYRVHLPWKDWLAVNDGAVGAAEAETKYKINFSRVKGEQIQFLNGEDLSLFLQVEYVLTAAQKQKARLTKPTNTVPTAVILAEKIITEEDFEYYVEIPVQRPPDFLASHRLWWRDGEMAGGAEEGGVFLKAQPTIVWQYRNTEHRLKVVEFRPVLAWFQAAPSTLPGDRADVRLEALRLQLQEKTGENWKVQLLLNGRFTVTREALPAVALGGEPEKAEKPLPSVEKRTVLKWEEKLPFAVREITTAHFFLGGFRRVKTEELFLLEGEVRGEITYLGKDGVTRYHQIRKELWANLPLEYGAVPVLIPVLSGWNCYPLTEWNWEKGGVWCEITIDLLACAPQSRKGKEVKG